MMGSDTVEDGKGSEEEEDWWKTMMPKRNPNADYKKKKKRKLEEQVREEFSEEEMQVLKEEVAKREEALFGDYKEDESPRSRWLIWLEVADKVNDVSTKHRNVEQVRIKWFEYKNPECKQWTLRVGLFAKRKRSNKPVTERKRRSPYIPSKYTPIKYALCKYTPGIPTSSIQKVSIQTPSTHTPSIQTPSLQTPSLQTPSTHTPSTHTLSLKTQSIQTLSTLPRRTYTKKIQNLSEGVLAKAKVYSIPAGGVQPSNTQQSEYSSAQDDAFGPYGETIATKNTKENGETSTTSEKCTPEGGIQTSTELNVCQQQSPTSELNVQNDEEEVAPKLTEEEKMKQWIELGDEGRKLRIQKILEKLGSTNPLTTPPVVKHSGVNLSNTTTALKSTGMVLVPSVEEIKKTQTSPGTSATKVTGVFPAPSAEKFKNIQLSSGTSASETTGVFPAPSIEKLKNIQTSPGTSATKVTGVFSAPSAEKFKNIQPSSGTSASETTGVFPAPSIENLKNIQTSPGNSATKVTGVSPAPSVEKFKNIQPSSITSASNVTGVLPAPYIKKVLTLKPPSKVTGVFSAPSVEKFRNILPKPPKLIELFPASSVQNFQIVQSSTGTSPSTVMRLVPTSSLSKLRKIEIPPGMVDKIKQVVNDEKHVKQGRSVESNLSGNNEDPVEGTKSSSSAVCSNKADLSNEVSRDNINRRPKPSDEVIDELFNIPGNFEAVQEECMAEDVTNERDISSSKESTEMIIQDILSSAPVSNQAKVFQKVDSKTVSKGTAAEETKSLDTQPTNDEVMINKAGTLKKVYPGKSALQRGVKPDPLSNEKPDKHKKVTEEPLQQQQIIVLREEESISNQNRQYKDSQILESSDEVTIIDTVSRRSRKQTMKKHQIIDLTEDESVSDLNKQDKDSQILESSEEITIYDPVSGNRFKVEKEKKRCTVPPDVKFVRHLSKIDKPKVPSNPVTVKEVVTEEKKPTENSQKSVPANTEFNPVISVVSSLLTSEWKSAQSNTPCPIIMLPNPPAPEENIEKISKFPNLLPRSVTKPAPQVMLPPQNLSQVADIVLQPGQILKKVGMVVPGKEVPEHPEKSESRTGEGKESRGEEPRKRKQGIAKLAGENQEVKKAMKEDSSKIKDVSSTAAKTVKDKGVRDGKSAPISNNPLVIKNESIVKMGNEEIVIKHPITGKMVKLKKVKSVKDIKKETNVD